MTNLENLNENACNTSLENITDEQAKNNIIFSQESIGEQKGRTLEEILAELESMNYEELGKKMSNVLQQYSGLLDVIEKNEKNILIKYALEIWLNKEIIDLERLKQEYGLFPYKELYVFKTKLGKQIYNLENFNKKYDDIGTGIKTAKKYESLDIKYQQKINDIIYKK